MSEAVTVEHRPGAKRPWRIRRGGEAVRLTDEQMDLVREAGRAYVGETRQAWIRESSGRRVHVDGSTAGSGG